MTDYNDWVKCQCSLVLSLSLSHLSVFLSISVCLWHSVRRGNSAHDIIYPSNCPMVTSASYAYPYISSLTMTMSLCQVINCWCLFLTHLIIWAIVWVVNTCVHQKHFSSLANFFCLNYRTLPSKPLSQWRHLWNQWNVQGRHIHWIRLQVPIRLQRNPLPTQ